MKKYIPSAIEPKWQKKWEESGIYKTPDRSSKPKKYILDMFPYPSGEGLHVGHPKGYVATDILSRYYRAHGFNVLHPMGWDAFGLPAENFAIKKGIHPKITTEKNIANIKRQMKMMSLSYDWSRETNTTDPGYYKWTQWIFLKLFEHGLAYEDEAPINFCPSCKTGLANEEVVAGKCERCGTKVERKVIRQWILRITKYADRLLEDLEGVDWPHFIKEMQINWIGRSEGSQIKFGVENHDYVIETFTTRVDTIFGVTALVLAPEHDKVDDLTTLENRKAVATYKQEALGKTDLERTQLIKDKTGVVTGSYAINPVNGERIPIWVADYVLGFYGTAAVMMVPAHDERDQEFAEKYGLEIRQVIDEHSQTLINSSQFNGLTVDEAKKTITEWLKERDKGDFKVSYKIRDWVFSRQRYWGEPIPVVHCEKCGVVPVLESELPLQLPDIEKYEPTGTGESPLAGVDDWVNTTCPKCKGPAKRETNTMPQWAGSCWYFLRFCDPNNDKFPIGKELEKYWMPVDWYVGGAEHAVLHLLYSRFWHKFLYDIKVVSTKEPYEKLSIVGLVLAEDGRKMSKSLGNVVTPDQIVAEYGADILRTYEAFMGPFENTISWDPGSINGVYRFLSRVWEVVGKPDAQEGEKGVEAALNKLIAKVGQDIEGMKFNTAIAVMMEFVNLVYHKQLTADQKRRFLIVLAPFAPHITEELWQLVQSPENYKLITNNWSIHQQSWPEFDKNQLEEEEISVAVQVNGKVRDVLLIQKDLIGNREVVENMAKESQKVRKFLEGKSVKKSVYVPGKIISLVVSS